MPAWLRGRYGFEQGSRLTLLDLDGAILLNPGSLMVSRLAAEMARSPRARRLSLRAVGGPGRQD